MTTAKKNSKKFILQGEHDKGGNMAKGITVFYYKLIVENLWIVSSDKRLLNLYYFDIKYLYPHFMLN